MPGRKLCRSSLTDLRTWLGEMKSAFENNSFGALQINLGINTTIQKHLSLTGWLFSSPPPHALVWGHGPWWQRVNPAIHLLLSCKHVVENVIPSLQSVVSVLENFSPVSVPRKIMFFLSPGFILWMRISSTASASGLGPALPSFVFSQYISVIIVTSSHVLSHDMTRRFKETDNKLCSNSIKRVSCRKIPLFPLRWKTIDRSRK